MKKLKFFTALWAIIFLTAGFSRITAQSIQDRTWTQPFSIFVPCANDGNGEVISGTWHLHVVLHFNNDGILTRMQVPGGISEIYYGEISGDEYKSVGSTHWLGDNTSTIGEFEMHVVESLHFVGEKGVRFMVKTNICILYPSGEILADFEHNFVDCNDSQK